MDPARTHWDDPRALLSFDQVLPRKGTGCVKYDVLPEGEDLIPLWVADMDFASPLCVEHALKRMADFGVYGYSLTPPGYLEAVQSWFSRRFGWQPEKDSILPVPGVVFGLGVILRALTRPGDGVLVQSPVYGHFFQVIEENGREVVNCPLSLRGGRYEIDFPALDEVLRRRRPRMFLLCSPHNPVGRVWYREELCKIAQLCRHYDILLVADEIHCDFVFPGQRHTPLLSLEEARGLRAISCTAPSKTFNLAGLQCANLIVPDGALRTALNRELSALGVLGCNLAGMTACQAAYEEGDRWLDPLLLYLSENLALVQEALAPFSQVKLVQPEGTYLLWLDCRGLSLSPEDLKNFFRRAGLWLSPGAEFGPGGEGFMRLNMACPRATLRDAMARLTAALNAL